MTTILTILLFLMMLSAMISLYWVCQDLEEENEILKSELSRLEREKYRL